MLCFKSNVLFFTFFHVVSDVLCLVPLQSVLDNDIGITEKIIRETIDNLFATLKIKDYNLRPILKDFSVLHEFFVSITLKDCDNLKKITRLTRVNTIDNNTHNFITQLNELLNNGDKSQEETEEIYITTYIKRFINRLRRLKESYGYDKNFRNFTINTDIVKHLNRGRYPVNMAQEEYETNHNHTSENNLSVNNTDDVWRPANESNSGRRIFEGHRTRIKYFPFMATVMFFEKFQCAGSIIRNDMVITAASCLQLAWNNRFFRENPAFLSVQVGCDFYMKGGENIPVLDIHFHPDYSPDTLNNNLALLRLSMHVVFSRVINEVKRIEYDQLASPMPSNTDGITILGWGARDYSNIIYGPWRNRLSYAELQYYPFNDCQDIYSKKFVTLKNFCAGFLSKGGGACSHDVGGPGIHAGILYGVISFGPPICGTVDAPTVFTKVGFYKKWIQNVLDMKVPQYHMPSTKIQSTITFAEKFSDRTKPTFTLTPFLPGENTALTRISDLPSDQDNYAFNQFMATMLESHEATESLQLDRDEELEKTKHKNTSERSRNQNVDEPNIDEKTSLDEDSKMEAEIINLLDDLDVYKLLGSQEVEKIADEQDALAHGSAKYAPANKKKSKKQNQSFLINSNKRQKITKTQPKKGPNSDWTRGTKFTTSNNINRHKHLETSNENNYGKENEETANKFNDEDVNKIIDDNFESGEKGEDMDYNSIIVDDGADYMSDADNIYISDDIEKEDYYKSESLGKGNYSDSDRTQEQLGDKSEGAKVINNYNVIVNTKKPDITQILRTANKRDDSRSDESKALNFQSDGTMLENDYNVDDSNSVDRATTYPATKPTITAEQPKKQTNKEQIVSNFAGRESTVAKLDGSKHDTDYKSDEYDEPLIDDNSFTYESKEEADYKFDVTTESNESYSDNSQEEGNYYPNRVQIEAVTKFDAATHDNDFSSDESENVVYYKSKMHMDKTIPKEKINFHGATVSNESYSYRRQTSQEGVNYDAKEVKLGAETESNIDYSTEDVKEYRSDKQTRTTRVIIEKSGQNIKKKRKRKH